MWRHEEGQILPLLVVVILTTLVLGLAALQVGKAAILRSSAQTAADAAALAAVRDIKTQLYAMFTTYGYSNLDAVSYPRAEAAAKDYARRNGAAVTGFDPHGVDVKVTVRTTGDKPGTAHARARLDLISAYGGLPSGAGGSIGPEPSETGFKAISADDWASVKKDIGSPPKCTDNPDDNDVVTLGRFLQKHGLMIGENNAFANTVDPVHVTGSWHYRCNDMGAIDVNAAGNEGAILDSLVAPLHRLGFRTIWRAAGHYDHMHIDAGCCDMGVGTANGPVGAGPIEDTILEVKLIDWNAAYVPFGGFGGLGGGSYGGRPDPDVARTVCAVLHHFGAPPKVVLSAYEAAIVESGVHDLNYGDRDSLGVFQQRPSAGWGTPEQILDVTYASTQYITRAIRNNQPWMSAGQLAQSVQISAFPHRYDAVAGQAAALISEYCS